MAARGIVGQRLAGRGRLRGAGFPPVGRRIMRSQGEVGQLERAGRMARAWRPVASSAASCMAVASLWRRFFPCWAADRAQRARSWPAGTGRADGAQRWRCRTFKAFRISEYLSIG